MWLSCHQVDLDTPKRKRSRCGWRLHCHRCRECQWTVAKGKGHVDENHLSVPHLMLFFHFNWRLCLGLSHWINSRYKRSTAASLLFSERLHMPAAVRLQSPQRSPELWWQNICPIWDTCVVHMCCLCHAAQPNKAHSTGWTYDADMMQWCSHKMNRNHLFHNSEMHAKGMLVCRSCHMYPSCTSNFTNPWQTSPTCDSFLSIRQRLRTACAAPAKLEQTETDWRNQQQHFFTSPGPQLTMSRTARIQWSLAVTKRQGLNAWWLEYKSHFAMSVDLVFSTLFSDSSLKRLITICVDLLPLAYSAGHKSRGRKLAEQYISTFLHFWCIWYLLLSK